MKRCIVIILLIFPFLSYGQQPYNPKIISEPTNEIVKEIERINELMGSAVYLQGMRPKQYDNFEKLKKTASQEELIALTNHPNGVVRCYAFWALSHNISVDLLPIVLNHINDDELIKTQFGCIGSQEMVGDFFIDIATPQHVDLESTKLDSAQRAKLDSILIYSDSKLNAKSGAICNAKPIESFYLRIKELYTVYNNPCALVAIAKFRKQEDIPLVLNNAELFYTYQAIQKFPHSDFFPLLKKQIGNLDKAKYIHYEWKALYEAIAAYKNKEAIDLLNIPFPQLKDIRGYVYNAIRKNKDEIYDSLFWKFWIEDNVIVSDVFQYLLEKDSIKVLELTKKRFANAYEINSRNWDLYSGEESNAIPIMLNFILKNDYELGIEIIQESIKDADDTHIDKVIELKDKSFIEPLFEWFAKEIYPYRYLKIAEALISYKDNTINKRILEIRKMNHNLNEGWGSEALNELLEENNIK